jgi:hypothetical protein
MPRTSPCTCLPEGADAADFTRWLGGDAGDVEFGVSSDKALVVSAPMACLTCQPEIEVIALYYELGFDEDMARRSSGLRCPTSGR